MPSSRALTQKNIDRERLLGIIQAVESESFLLGFLQASCSVMAGLDWLQLALPDAENTPHPMKLETIWISPRTPDSTIFQSEAHYLR